MSDLTNQSKNESLTDDNDQSNDQIKGDDGDVRIEIGIPSSLPPELKLPESCTVLETPEGSKVYLVGTAHFSKKSCQEVQDVIRQVQPNVVVLEICPMRAHILFGNEETLIKGIKNFNWFQLRDFIRTQGLIQGLTRALFYYQSKQIVEQLDILPGCEFRAAFVEAKMHHSEIVLGDRQIDITLNRVMASLSFWDKIRFAFTVLSADNTITTEEMENLKNQDMLEEMLKSLSDKFPVIKQVIVDERDLYLAYRLQEAASRRSDIEFSVQTKKVKESIASFLNCEKRLTTCRNELDNFKKVVKGKNVEAQKNQLRIWEQKLFDLEQQYRTKQQQMLNEEEKLAMLKSRNNEDLFVPSVVVGVVGIGHISGITKHWNKVKESDILPIVEIPEPSRTSVIVRKSIKYTFVGFSAYLAFRYLLPRSTKVLVQNGSQKLYESMESLAHSTLQKVRK